jgi:hypothetical protein
MAYIHYLTTHCCRKYSSVTLYIRNTEHLRQCNFKSYRQYTHIRLCEHMKYLYVSSLIYTFPSWKLARKCIKRGRKGPTLTILSRCRLRQIYRNLSWQNKVVSDILQGRCALNRPFYAYRKTFSFLSGLIQMNLKNSSLMWLYRPE